MKKDAFEQILSEVDVLVEDPRFYPKVFDLLCKARRKEYAKVGDNIQRVIVEEYEDLSRRLDESLLQESSSFRNVLKSRKLANLLIDDEGKLQVALLPRTIKVLQEHLYSLGPNRQFDAKRSEHMLNALTLLQDNQQLQRRLMTVSKPHMHRYAEQIIRDTLSLPPKTVVVDAHARRAALSAWLCYLRQNVGSCFATAPAIVVHDEQPEVFFKDVQELLSTGRLKRTFGGIEYAVPLSYSWGSGDLRRVFLFQKGAYQEEQKIWLSPGLIEAFEFAGMINSELSQKEKEKISKELIINTLVNWDTNQSWFFASIEQILRKILLNHFELTEEDVHEYELRPSGMIHGGLLMQPPTTSAKGKSKGEKCSQFLQQFEETKNIFKAISDNALLKSWEFTLASFAETKAQFTRWNLYSSLGLRPEDKGGIGPCLYTILKRKLDECNENVQKYNEEYEAVYPQLLYYQRRIRNATSEKDAQWIRAEYQAKANEFRSLEELRDKFHNKARRYANLYDGLIDLYYRLFPNYFQEIYDADIHEVTAGPYDDSPAGFRLLYKYGRSNTSQWTQINNHMEFIDALASFFIATETELTNAPEMKGLEEDLTEIFTAIVTHVRSTEFIETAFHRMAATHHSPIIKDPLENLGKVEKKPWVYTSGGAMSTLVSCYFRLETKPKEVSRWVENPMELLVFLIDSVKEVSDKILDEFEADPEKSLLIHSPTHAFLLKPGYPQFKEAWKSKEYTYTWVRDHFVRPMEEFCSKIFLDAERMQFVIENLYHLVPHNFQHYFKQSFANIGGSMQITDFRQHILDTIELSKGLQYAGRGVLTSEQIDSVLYSLLPLFPSYKLKERVKTILSQLPGISKDDRKTLITILEEISGRIGSEKTISAKGLQNITKAMLALVTFSTSTQHDYPLLISQIAQKEGFALPTPFICADSNWVKDHFAFLVNPGSGRFEFWRMDYTGSYGAPLTDWEEWLNGSRKTPTWGVYNNPYEYSL
ncbi:MAG: hypothetical protein K940chlam7_00376 [Chlamydiae bacterium]|nr:hypothetical protein [Chlamydiota bacterium]